MISRKFLYARRQACLLVVMVFAALSLAACSSSDSSSQDQNTGPSASAPTNTTPTGGNGNNQEEQSPAPACGSEAKTLAVKKIQDLDTNPLSVEASTAVKKGCDISKTNVSQFMQALLTQLGLDSSEPCANDASVREAVDNWEGIDLSDLQASCS